MLTRVLALCALALGILFNAARQAPAVAGLSDAEKATLRQNDETFTKAANARDFAACAAMYLEYVRANYTMAIARTGAAPAHDRGKYVEIWRKQADGSWKMRWDIFNSGLAPGQSQ